LSGVHVEALASVSIALIDLESCVKLVILGSPGRPRGVQVIVRSAWTGWKKSDFEG
jgi:hypothetical protein